MKKNLFYNYGFDSYGTQRTSKIKNAGFDGVFISLEDGSEIDEKEIPLIQEKLNIETLHLMSKGEASINSIWLDGNDGDLMIDKIIEGIDFAKKYNIKKVIMHLISSVNHPSVSEIGLKRVKRVADYCDKIGILLCIENQRDMNHLFYVFNNIDNKCLRFCLDTGHANAFTQNLNEFPFEFFKKYLACLHLHDNDGTFDSHELPFYGKIDWKTIINEIYKCNPDIELTLEIHPFAIKSMNIQSEEEFLNKAYESLVKLESLIDR